MNLSACSVAWVVSNSLRARGLYSPPGSSVHGILQARILEWVAISFSSVYTYKHIHIYKLSLVTISRDNVQLKEVHY